MRLFRKSSDLTAVQSRKKNFFSTLKFAEVHSLKFFVDLCSLFMQIQIINFLSRNQTNQICNSGNFWVSIAA